MPVALSHLAITSKLHPRLVGIILILIYWSIFESVTRQVQWLCLGYTEGGTVSDPVKYLIFHVYVLCHNAIFYRIIYNVRLASKALTTSTVMRLGWVLLLLFDVIFSINDVICSVWSRVGDQATSYCFQDGW